MGEARSSPTFPRRRSFLSLTVTFYPVGLNLCVRLVAGGDFSPGGLFELLVIVTPLTLDLCILSLTIIPTPPGWPPSVHKYGYRFLPVPPGWQPPPDLVEFITSGSPPVYIGFGSMANQRAEKTTRQVVAALKLVGQRGVLAGGWGSLGRTDFKDIFVEAGESC